MYSLKKKYIAHIRSSDQCSQPVFEHNDSVAVLAKSVGVTYGLESLAFLCGRYHDIGKNTEMYYDYIISAAGK